MIKNSLEKGDKIRLTWLMKYYHTYLISQRRLVCNMWNGQRQKHQPVNEDEDKINTI